MSRLPRILPLVAIAGGGLLAYQAVASYEGAPAMFKAAKAFAEGAAKPAPKAAAGSEAAKSAAGSESAPGDTAAKPAAGGEAASGGSGKTAPQACGMSAADLAKIGGLSAEELSALQSLRDRRGQLDDREKTLDTQAQLVATAEAKLDAKIGQLGQLKSDIVALLNQAGEKEAAEQKRLVTVYSAMKPKDAAAVLATLDDTVRIPVTSQMKERTLAAILGQMKPSEAKELTEKLARQYEADKALAARAQAAVPGK